MRPKKHQTTGSNDLFRALLDQIINLKHELVLLAGKIDWDWIDREIAPLYSEHCLPEIAYSFHDRAICCSSTFTSYPTRACASAESMTRISNTSPTRSSSSMPSRTSGAI